MRNCLLSLLWLFKDVFWVAKVEQVCNHVYAMLFFTCTLLRFLFVTFIAIHVLVPGAGINLSSLLIKEGKVCWDLYIDGLVISSDGNLLDALGAAIKVILVMCVWFSLLTLSLRF